ncbi:endolytic transglycosylase MltG [Bacillus songklensis]|uniref:Endolytic murein transglycosylase n=1 Tax=Bacillus songklensis TaxID=1069116 RepID=A0ABV8B0E4_9BACI
MVFGLMGLLIASMAVGAFIYINSALSPVNEKSKNIVEITISRGSSVGTIAKRLEDQGVIKDERVFRYYVKLKNEQSFQAGNYAFSQAMSVKEIIRSLQTGESAQKPKIRLPIPEGSQLVQISEIIAANTGYTKEQVLKKMSDKQFIQILSKKYPDLITNEVFAKNIKYPLEGYFYPATYSFYTDKVSLEEILDKMVGKTNEVIHKYKPLMKEKNVTSHKLLTMASLIEEEATEKTDREKIASVFYNRLEAGMPLQTDPTVLYALGEHKDRVFYKDLKVESPYNTYKVKGLTPGPIANAGELSIVAALKPAETEYLYFLATSTGEVIFTKTLEEHNKQKALHITKQENTSS